jgi:hypothetical protein
MKNIFIIASVLSVFMFSCRTPEQLIDLAIKRNPSIKIGQSDTVQITSFIIDSIPVIINDSIVYEKIIRKVKTDTIFKTNSIIIERKKTRQEIRKENNLSKLNLRLKTKIEKLELRLNEKIEKDNNRTEVKIERINNRSRWLAWLIFGMVIGFFIRIIVGRLKNNLKKYLF